MHYILSDPIKEPPDCISRAPEASLHHHHGPPSMGRRSEPQGLPHHRQTFDPKYTDQSQIFIRDGV